MNTVKKGRDAWLKRVGYFLLLLLPINTEITLNSEGCLFLDKYAQILVTLSNIYLLGNLKYPSPGT